MGFLSSIENTVTPPSLTSMKIRRWLNENESKPEDQRESFNQWLERNRNKKSSKSKSKRKICKCKK